MTDENFWAKVALMIIKTDKIKFLYNYDPEIAVKVFFSPMLNLKYGS
jgi:hypothetical protein